jgi:hypothetical protein
MTDPVKPSLDELVAKAEKQPISSGDPFHTPTYMVNQKIENVYYQFCSDQNGKLAETSYERDSMPKNGYSPDPATLTANQQKAEKAADACWGQVVEAMGPQMHKAERIERMFSTQIAADQKATSDAFKAYVTEIQPDATPVIGDNRRPERGK